MDKPKKSDPIEQAHFRIDEHERKFRGYDEMASKVPGMVDGAVGVLRASMKAEFMELVARDIKADTEVIARLDRLCECIERQCEKLDRVCEALMAPCTRESTINLPSGPVHMTVRERKN